MGGLLRENPMLVLILVIGVGYLLGKIRIGGFSLGVSAVLFAGLAFSAYDPRLALPEIVYELGLVVFVYAVGLAAGPGFVNALRRRGWRENALTAVVLLASGAGAVGAALAFGIDKRMAAGMFTGSFTNTPALAGVVQALDGDSTPVIGYSLAYPIGVLGVITVISLLERRWRPDRGAAPAISPDAAVRAWTVRVTRDDRPTVQAVVAHGDAEVQVSRLRLNGDTRLAWPDDTLAPGALVTVVGERPALERTVEWLGERVRSEHLPWDRRHLDSRRMFVSNPQVAHRPLRTLGLLSHEEVIITRVRRGDADMVATADTILEIGDRVRVVGSPERLDQAARLFGDSYQAASEVNILSFAIGIGLGLLLGMIPFPMPGGALRLGPAGGTLIVALVLGAFGRTGRVVWQLPYGVATTLRQVGVVLFLAGIGTRAGGNLRGAMSDPRSLRVIGVGAVLTMAAVFVVLLIGRKWLRIPFDRLTGVVAGMQTQPAVLAFASERYAGEAANLGYATVYPLAMILKIIIAQLVLMLAG
jgi:putative transport protein